MSINQPDLLHILSCKMLRSLRCNCSAHRKLQLIRTKDCLVKSIEISALWMNEEFMRRTCQWIECFTSSTSLNSLVTAKHFCPCFLENKHPYFFDIPTSPIVFIAWPAKRPSAPMVVIWEVVINYYSPLLSIYKKTHCIAASLIDAFSYENFLDSVWIFSESTQTWQEIAITTFSLFDVIWSNVFKDREGRISIDFFWPFPDKSFPVTNTLVLHHVIVEDRARSWREIWINEITSIRDNWFVINWF